MRTTTRRAAGFIVRRDGLRPHFYDDSYHFVMTARWRTLFLLFAGIFTAFNSFFALLFLLGGDCISQAQPGSFADYFFFSVQTMATIGYGAMAPKTFYAHVIVSLEAMTGLFVLALTTGMVIAKFTRPTARVLFSHNALFTKMNGNNALIFRMANVRTNQVVDAKVDLHLIRKEVTPEGISIRRFYPLKLDRDTSPLFILSWTVIHNIDADSPLFGKSPDELRAMGAVLSVSLKGTDGDFSQSVHARHTYGVDDLVWGGMFVDILSQDPDGGQRIDFTKFHLLR